MGDKMKKIIGIIFVVSILAGFGLHMYIKENPPLAIGGIGESNSNKAILLPMGNAGHSDIKITEVLVNDREKPVDSMIQVSNPLKPLVIAHTFKGKVTEYGLRNLKDATLQANTSPKSQLKKFKTVQRLSLIKRMG